MDKRPLIGHTDAELKAIAKNLGMLAFTGGQIARWLYVQHVTSIEEMTNISKANRERLSAEYCIGAMAPVDCQRSKDGTVKYLFPTENGKTVETVFIPEKDRATLCVSCQVGCKMNCLFCQTGKQGFEGQLTVRDILNQIYSLPERERLTNIVFMGQGEPMDNLDNVLRATKILTAKYAYAWSPKRITVSSVGVRGKLQRFLDESDCHVAISLHTPLPEQRAQLMPAERGMSLTEVVKLMENYFPARRGNHRSAVANGVSTSASDAMEETSHQRRLTFEYTVFSGVNDTPTHLKALVQLLRNLDCRVNLIRFHQIPDVDLHGADDKQMEHVCDYLNRNGITATIRASRGQDIYAACGLLNTKHRSKSLTSQSQDI